jgi:hypothetical protein
MTRKARLRVVSGFILGIGLTGATAIYVTSPPASELPAGYDITQTKRYRHDLELYGGKANVQLDEFRRWFQTLWHGRSLAGTIAFLSVMTALAIRFFSEHAPPDATGRD